MAADRPTVGWVQSQPTIQWAESVCASITRGSVSQNEVVIIDTFGRCRRCVLPPLQGVKRRCGLSNSILKHAGHRLDSLASGYEVNISKINGLHAPLGPETPTPKSERELCVCVWWVCVWVCEWDRDSTWLCVESWLSSEAKNYFTQG